MIPPTSGDASGTLPRPPRAPTFSESPTEAHTGRTSQEASDWRQLLQTFDALELEGKDALTQIAAALLRAQVMRKARESR